MVGGQVFYLLWQKEIRELSAGVYNLLKTTRRHAMSVSMFLDSVEASDEHLEANLSTMLQSVRGTKQYWFLRQSELKCMIREWGSPTLFLTFSCAEYESPDITEFLRRVNNVSSGYNIGETLHRRSHICMNCTYISQIWSRLVHTYIKNCTVVMMLHGHLVTTCTLSYVRTYVHV